MTIIFIYSAPIQFLFFFNMKYSRIICSPKRKRATFRTPCTSRLTRRDIMHSWLRETRWCARIRRTFSPWGKSIGSMETRQRLARFMSLIARSNRVARREIRRPYFHGKIFLDGAFLSAPFNSKAHLSCFLDPACRVDHARSHSRFPLTLYGIMPGKKFFIQEHM